MAWVSDDLTAPGVAGNTVANNDVISKVFTVEDPRYLVVQVEGGLTTYKIQTRVGNQATWTDVKTASAARLVFSGPEEIGTTYPGDGADLLCPQVRIVATGAGDVDNVWICRHL